MIKMPPISTTNIAIASIGPSVRNDPYEANVSADIATIVVPADPAIEGPTRDIADRIAIYYSAEGPIPGVVGRFGDYIRQETLSQELVPGPPPEGAYKESICLGGAVMELGVVRRG